MISFAIQRRIWLKCTWIAWNSNAIDFNKWKKIVFAVRIIWWERISSGSHCTHSLYVYTPKTKTLLLTSTLWLFDFVECLWMMLTLCDSASKATRNFAFRWAKCATKTINRSILCLILWNPWGKAGNKKV